MLVLSWLVLLYPVGSRPRCVGPERRFQQCEPSLGDDLQQAINSIDFNWASLHYSH